MALVALAALLGPAAAQAEPAPRPLQDNRFALDIFQGPLLAPIDVTGTAGSYAAYAEGIAGMVANAAAPAVREAYSTRTFEIDGSGSISFPFPVDLGENNDFDNNGILDYNYSHFIYITLGGMVRYGPLGAGFSGELQSYTLTDTQGQPTQVAVGKFHLLGAVRLFGDQLMLGAGARFATLGFSTSPNLTMVGAAPEFGFLIRPDWQSFRIGGTFRMAVDGGPLPGEVAARPDEVRKVRGLVLPDHVVLPWELEVGVAVQVGPRPLNPTWLDPRAQEEELRATFAARRKERRARLEGELSRIEDATAREARRKELEAREAEHAARSAEAEAKSLAALEAGRRARFRNWPREHLLVTAEMLVTGQVADGVSIQQFLGQNFEAEQKINVVGSSGARVNFSPRLGVEGEPLPDRVHTRFGSYYEPYRFFCATQPQQPCVGRQHFTFGADVKLFRTTWFGLVPEIIYKLQASADLAPRYQSFSIGAGVWN